MSEQPGHSKDKIAIIGAGFGGMAAAYDLRFTGKQVCIYEAADTPGGLAAGFKEPYWDWSVEKFYHHWFASDKHMHGLIAELGWQDQVIFKRPYTVVFDHGKFVPFDSIPKMIMFPGLGWGINKIRFGLVGLFLKLTSNWKSLEHYRTEEWMRKYAGNKVYELMWEPLMVGKFGERYAREVNMAWLWARIKSRTTRLATFQGGFQAFANKFADHLSDMGVQITYSARVEQIRPAEDGGVILDLPTGPEHYDQVLVTTSPGLLAKLAPELPSDYLQGLLNLKSMGAVVMVLSLKHQLSEQGYYWYNIPKKAGFPFLALVEHTNFLSPEHFGGDHIVYIGDYLEVDHEYFQLNEQELLERFLPVLPRFNSSFQRDWIKKVWLWRTPYAQPIPLVDHSKNIPAIQTPIPGLYFASMSQVYPWDRGTNFAVEIGRRAARIMLQV
jgi:protoporphyrinogen oxidase